jgi:D-threo-aldose 1-dehydrogenase
MTQFPIESRRPFGKTGLPIPPIVFGATSLGNLFRSVEPAEKSRIVEEWTRQVASPAMIDSAGKYGAGMSLEVIGRELQRLGIDPSDVIISNKLAWRRVPMTGSEPTFEPGAWFDLEYDAVQDISHDGILRCWEQGNQLLAPYKASLVTVHDPDEYLAAASDESDYKQRVSDIVGAYRALEQLRDSGEVIGVGIGAKDWKSIRLLANHCQFDWVMFANSYTIYSHPAELSAFMDQLSKENVGVINSALFHGGFLVGGDFFDYKRVDPSVESDSKKIQWRSAFWQVCTDFDVSPMDAACAFGRLHPAVNAVAISSSRADRVASHVESVTKQVPADFWSELYAKGLIEQIPKQNR